MTEENKDQKLKEATKLKDKYSTRAKALILVAMAWFALWTWTDFGKMAHPIGLVGIFATLVLAAVIYLLLSVKWLLKYRDLRYKAQYFIPPFF